MIEQLEIFKEKIKQIRGNKSMHQMSREFNLPSMGSYRGLELYGNPQLLSLLRITENSDIEIIIKNGKIKL